MIKIIKKWALLPAKIRRFCEPTGLEARIMRSLDSRRLDSRVRPVVLVQCVEDLYYYSLFGKICSRLKANFEVRVDQFVLRSASVGEFTSVKHFLFSRFILNRLLNIKWTRLYRVFCDEIGYASSDWKSPFGDAFDFWQARLIWKKLKNREELSNLTISGISIGDLVNDTYIRFKPAATVNLQDRYLMLVIWQALCDIRRAKKYFSRIKPILFFTSYSTYVQHGIAVRVALSEGTRVFSFGNFQQLTKELTLTDWMHTKDPLPYAEQFLRLENQAEKLVSAEAGLSVRLNGGIDRATTYMKQSAYHETELMTVNASGAVIIFLHDFFDSPHGYYDMIFPDFWEWVLFTIKTLEKNNIRFLIKPHPNQIELSDETLSNLKRHFPNANFISQNITNKQLVNGGAVCAVTAFGTVAHEMAYLGVPTIACARHPHISFDFCVTAKNRSEYAEALISAPRLRLDREEMRRQSLRFYYMHNLNLEPDETQLRDALLAFRGHCAKISSTDSGEDLVNELDRIAELPAFQAWIEKWQPLLNASVV